MAKAKTFKIFIDGEAGTTGLEIREKLAGRKDVELVSIDPAKRKELGAKTERLAGVDVAILCLPDDAARESAAIIDSLGDSGPRILDASSAHRIAPGWVYGFPEMAFDQAEKIAAARKVSNPGCYATGAVAIARPLVEAGLIAADAPLALHAVSGYSGGGRHMIEAYETHQAPPFEAYAYGLEHKHIPEIQQWAKLSARPMFMPSVGAFRQGMIVNLPLFLDLLPGKPTGADLEQALQAHYAGSKFVSVVRAEKTGRLDALGLNGTNKLELRVFANEGRRQAVVVARLDNLGKGASSAAVQNLDLMLGVCES